MTKRVIQKKICLLGDFAVGKTSLIRRYVEGRYDEKYLSTIGVNISRKAIEQEDYMLNLLIWDLAGGDDFATVGRSYLSGAVAALIVCDLTRPDTLETFTVYATKMLAINPQAKLLFVGIKADLEAERCVAWEDAAAVSDGLGGRFFVTSAKTGYQVEDAFHHLAGQIEI